MANTYNLTTAISVSTTTASASILVTRNLATYIQVASAVSAPNVSVTDVLTTAIGVASSTSMATVAWPLQVPAHSGRLLGGQSNLIGELLLVTLPGQAGRLLGAQGAPITTTYFTVVVEGTSGRLLGARANLVVLPVTLPVIVPGWSGKLSGSIAGLVANYPKVVILPGGSGRLLGALAWVVEQSDIECWVLTDNTFNPSAYTNWPFNSFALRNGKYYAAGPDGLYLLEGEDQNGGPKPCSGVRIGRINFSTERKKRIRSMRLGATGPEVQVRVESEGKEDTFQLNGQDIITVSREVQGHEFFIDIQDFEELSFIEIIPLVLALR